ncbi:hypothetical protein KVR01_008677 [Diaporthe batatas]|uniref:uncharacterized protein n=1 Tax=Diaporthe batatas TaxID=748121 RepID=UPI001D042964|nr:uncharacterized protein KVR01_008677 [Diaporthe batatas]KAG8161690.1 hypothetical protein KVR01_008677 [Diaporthe batatas]
MPDDSVLEFVVSQTWKCLSVKVKGKNSIFAKCFFDQEILSEIAQDANIFFAPGLLEAMTASTPPDVNFFKSLPVKYLGVWGIYVLVLEKKNHPTLVYIGEASDAKLGVRGRWRHYENPRVYRKMLPTCVKAALDSGYKISYKGVLAYFGIPSAKDVPRFRVLSYALECMFAFYFWTMRSITKDYGIGSCCPWPRDSFTYGGLCSHSSLNDPMRARLDLSAEQLELLASQNDMNKRARETRARRRDAKIYHCDDYDSSFSTPSELVTHKAGVMHKKRVADNAAGVEREFECPPCGKKYKKIQDLEKHEEGPRHAAVIARTPVDARPPPRPPRVIKKHPKRTKEERESQILYCPACDLHMKRPSQVIIHNRSAGHKKREADIAAGLDPDPEPLNLHCDSCDVTCKKRSEMIKHNNSAKHKKRIANLAAGKTYDFRCKICDKSFVNIHQLNTHKEKSARHKQRVAALEASA